MRSRIFDPQIVKLFSFSSQFQKKVSQMLSDAQDFRMFEGFEKRRNFWPHFSVFAKFPDRRQKNASAFSEVFFFWEELLCTKRPWNSTKTKRTEQQLDGRAAHITFVFLNTNSKLRKHWNGIYRFDFLRPLYIYCFILVFKASYSLFWFIRLI